jgi:hypothetical protein
MINFAQCCKRVIIEQNSELSSLSIVQGPCRKLFLREYIFEIAGQETVKADVA